MVSAAAGAVARKTHAYHPTAAPPLAPPGAADFPGDVRTFLSAVLIALVAVLVPASAVAYWADRELGDADRYTAAMSPLASDPAVQEVVIRQAGRALSEQIDAGPLQGALDALLGEALRSFVGTPAYQTAWDAANRAAHAAFFQALTTGHGNAVTIDLAPVIAQIRGELIADGVPFADRIPVTHLSVTVMEYDNLGALRKGFRMLQIAGVWLPVLTVVLLFLIHISDVYKRQAVDRGSRVPAAHPGRPAGRHRPPGRRRGLRRTHRVPAHHRLGRAGHRARDRAGRMAGGPSAPHALSTAPHKLGRYQARRTAQSTREAPEDRTEAE